LLEIADIFVVHKADREGAGHLATELEATLHLVPRAGWRPPVLQTQAPKGEGVDVLHRAIQEHRAALEGSSRLAEKRRQRRQQEFLKAGEEGVGAVLRDLIRQEGHLAARATQVADGQADPFAAAQEVLKNGALVQDWLASLGKKP
ncbi:MAG: hypothetical protein HY686_08715, partial [Chloroflexi bacterium]|nr:hypothetical protein [Chloroflexota bacterium]